jgi:hypothetical protein
MQGGRSALRAPGGHLHPVNVPSSTAVGGGHSGPTNELSPDSWFGHSSPHETGNVNASAPSQREPHEEDLQSNAKAPTKPSSNVASAIAAVAPSAVTAAGLGAINDTKARVHDGENRGDDTSEGSKKKEPMFLGGVKLVNLDDCDIPDRRLQCDS